jgi:hypothetical protein
MTMTMNRMIASTIAAGLALVLGLSSVTLATVLEKRASRTWSFRRTSPPSVG